MKNSTEQYRVGFEAWAQGYGYDCDKSVGDYIDATTVSAWNAWVAAKSEASTEPSAVRPPGAQPCHLCEGQGFINQCVICGSAEPRTGSCGSDDPRALCNFVAGALPDEPTPAALMAARAWIVKNRPAMTLARQATIDEYMALLGTIDAAIAQSKAGKDQT